MIASSSSKLLKLSPPLRTFSTLYTWGDYSGGLGQGEHTPTLLQSYGIPQKVMTNVSQVSMGKDHSALITTDGQLMTTGSGEAYQLGNSQQTTNQPSFQPVPFFSTLPLQQVSCDEAYTLVLTQSGSVYEMGIKRHGLFVGDYAQTPSLLSIPQIVTQVSAGKGYGMAITESGSVYSWGVSDYGCQGDGKGEFKAVPEENYRFKQLKEKKSITAVKICIIGNSTLALMSDGTLYSCGQNYQGQLGLRKQWGMKDDQFNEILKPLALHQFSGHQIKDIAISEACTVVLTSEGKVFYSGFGSSYQLTEDTSIQHAISIAVRDDAYYVLQQNGQMTISHPLNCLSSQPTVDTHSLFSSLPKYIGGNYGLSYALV